MRALPTLFIIFAAPVVARGQIERIWLTHRTSDPSRLVVNWETAVPGDSVVHFGVTAQRLGIVSQHNSITLHHVEIATPLRNVVYHYSVQTGTNESPDYTFRAYPTDELRVAVVGDWTDGKSSLDALKRDQPHLLLTAGDNISCLHALCGAGVKDCTKSYSALIDAQPELFRSTPFLPALGNHDKEIRPRGKKAPPEMVYDLDATAYRRFFPLPGDQWKWAFDIPEFDVQFIALDLEHITDFGTTWQACHDFHRGSPQFEWYRELMATTRAGFVITLHNEYNDRMRSQEGGAWHDMFRRGTIVVSGFGYYAERAVVDGFTYYNTCVAPAGTPYRDPKSEVFESTASYMLFTFHKSAGEMTAELKRLDGSVIDRQVFHTRRR
jgi:hypothetical protein